MKLVLFKTSSDKRLIPGILTDHGVVDISMTAPVGHTPQLTMQQIIDDFEALRPKLEVLAKSAPPLSLDSIRLGPPLPRPGKIVCCIGNYWEHAQRERGDLNMFFKNPDAVIGPGDTIELPDFTEPSSFMHEAELAVVLKGPIKKVSAANWRDAVFGYTAGIDVTARGEGRYTWKKLSWLGKSFDTFCPIGPCIVTADEIADPNDLRVQLWNNEDLRHNYVTDDMEHRVPELVEFATRLMTFNTGDLIFCGTNHEGLGYLQDGEQVTIEIQGIGRMTLSVTDPLKRKWDRGVYLGVNSTHPDAVQRNRPQTGGSAS
jgi:2-keto-4-pentenoate hydratase/2-oxohepta-3-ene-1,7-dioic acid hydratase in catechol pathway